MVSRRTIFVASGLCLVALASTLLLTQASDLRHPRVAHTTASAFITPGTPVPAGLKTIFSNLGPTPTDEYNDTTGYYVLGSANGLGDSEQWIAFPFTPKANSHAEQIMTAVQWNSSGTNQFILTLNSDNAGLPGTVLATMTVKNAPTFGTCCKFSSAKIASPGVALTAKTQYWVVAQADDVNASTFEGVWASSNDNNIAANEAQSGWFSFSNNVPALSVSGTVP